MLLPSEAEEKQREERKNTLRKFLDLNFILFLVLDILVIGFMIFSLWGTLSFWQPGAELRDKWVAIRGMYPDLEYHKSFTKPYLPKVEEVFLSQGLFTYKIDCKMENGAIRTGVPTFSWAQFSVLILVIINVWILTKFILPRKTVSKQNIEVLEGKI